MEEKRDGGGETPLPIVDSWEWTGDGVGTRERQIGQVDKLEIQKDKFHHMMRGVFRLVRT